jgi:hypothetical protein
MNARILGKASGASLGYAALGLLLALSGCSGDGSSSGGVSSSVAVGYGYGGYYGPYYGGGYYEPYPPVVVVPPGERPDRPDAGNRPTTLPADVGGASNRPSARPSTAPTRPSTSSRPTSRPSPRPAPRPMPSGGRRR